jgi:CRISPR-associated endonuclease Csn1
LKPEEEEYVKKIYNFLKKASEAKRDIRITPYDHITADENVKLYDRLASITGNDMYNQKYMYRVPFEKLKEGRQLFVDLTLEAQCKALGQILSLFKCSVVKSNLELIGGSKNTVIFLMPNKISEFSTAYIINQSVTGLFQKKVNLLK